MDKRVFLKTLLEFGIVLFFAVLVGIAIQWPLLNLPTLPTGGDTASHLLYAWLFFTEFAPSGRVTAWMPEVFAGFPAFSYYFPLPFMAIALFAKLFGFAVGFKWAMMLPSLLLPGTVYIALRRLLRVHALAALSASLASLAYLLHEQNSIWGGNLLSTLAGEFAYSYGQLFAVLTLAMWLRVRESGKAWVLAAILEAMTGASHGYPLLVVGFSTAALLFLDPEPRKTLWLLVKGHGLAFCLLAGWLWPLLEMHGYTVPNDGAYWVKDWHELLPSAMMPVAIAGVAGVLMCLLPAVRRTLRPQAARSALFFASAAMFAATGWMAAESLGLADIRFFPLVWLFGGIAIGIGFGEGLAAASAAWRPRQALIFQAACAVALLVAGADWLVSGIRHIPEWAVWNFSGYETKPQWQNLARLFPVLKGNIASPRLVFEHDPANGDLGSTRSLEALPMFLGGRPVLEGLYMESALLGPAIYWLQSEVSAKPSSPLSRFPSGSLDADAAAIHMNWLHADTLLLRSADAKRAMESSAHFDKIAEAAPFSVYRLRNFSSRLVEPVVWPLQAQPRDGWMDGAFDWFRFMPRHEMAQPYYPMPGQDESPRFPVSSSGIDISEVRVGRDEIRFSTSAIGVPHLVKMAFHPRWQLESRGTLMLVAPGFMLVVPQEKEVVLRFGTTPLGMAGQAVCAIAWLLAACLLAWHRKANVEVSQDSRVMPRRFAVWVLILVTASIAFHQNSPERSYRLGWQALLQKDYVTAADRFSQAIETRHGRGRKEEAMFWAARARESGNRPEEALQLYSLLVSRFNGYWVPEAFYSAVVLAKKNGKQDESDALAKQLREKFPKSRWTDMLEKSRQE